MAADSEFGIVKSLDKLYEFEHEPVSEDKLQSGKHFAGVFAGEHVAGTEFVIGALFVAWGVTAFDIFVGLLIGNAMAVLTWTFICAPIAVRTRLTLYWYLRKVAGPITTTTYNILNAILFCILAGCMITVSASAVRIPFNIPAQIGWFPTDLRFVIVVVIVGAVVVTLAILGFKKLAQFAEVCSPWLFLMFICGAIVMLPAIAAKTLESSRIESFRDFWTIANKVIWTGSPPDGSSPISFWHVAAFAWICNLAMHGGLSDMALLRYAKKMSYGLYSAFGMFLGHYLAWIAAGIMGAAAALILKTTISQLDAGGVANQALGISGIIAVVIAGWTTSNPTLYRAGLAFQAVTPNWPRWLVTLIAGIVTTLIACSPWVFTKLLNFVGYYGLLLMPVGAIVFAEHWIFPKIGLTQYWISYKKRTISWPSLLAWIILSLPALLAWGIAIAVALRLEKTHTLHLFFLFIPTWVLTIILYIVFASLAGAKEKFSSETLDEKTECSAAKSQLESDASFAKTIKNNDVILWLARIMAIASLLLCLVLALWVYVGNSDGYEQRFSVFKTVLLWPSLCYFVFGTVWLTRKNKVG
ncbi:MAG: purine-cytosine permease family protein [Planctomycetota bacterium]|jgi:NCS1 family nucleobase:cation symporter-1